MDKKTLQVILQDHPVAYHPILAKATGSVNAAILLSQLLYWQGKGDNPEWTYKTRDEIYEETGLSRREQETARRHLGLLHILHERRAGVPARIYYHVDMDALVEVLAAYQQKTADKAEPSSVSDPEMRPAEDTEDTVQLAQNVPSSWHKMYHLDGTKCTNWMAQNVPTNTESTTETTTEITQKNICAAGARDEPVPANGTTSLSPPDALFQEIMTICQHTDHTITPAVARHISAAAERLAAQGATPEDVRLFPQWWATYWKGRNGNPIEPRNVMEEWGRFTAWRNQQTETERKIEQWDGWLR